MTRRAFVSFLLVALAACGRPAAPADVASWLRASSGVLQSWLDGAISASAADSNLASTEKMIADLPRGSVQEGVAGKLEQAGRIIGDARRAVVADDRRAAKDASMQLRILAAQLATP